MLPSNEVQRLILNLDDKSADVVHHAWGELLKHGHWCEVAEALGAQKLKRKRGLICAFNLLSNVGYPTKAYIPIYEQYINPKKPDVMYSALHALVFLKNTDSLTKIRSLLAGKSLKADVRQDLLLAEEALVKGEPKIFSRYYGDGWRWEPNGQEPAGRG